MASVGRVDAGLYFATEPRVVISSFFLALDEFAHEVAQQLRAGTVARLGRAGEVVLQGLIDAECESGFAHG